MNLKSKQKLVNPTIVLSQSEKREVKDATIESKEQKKLPILKYLKGLLVIVLFFLAEYFQLIPITLFHIDLKTMSDTTAILLSLFSNIVLALILFFIYRKDLKREWTRFTSQIGKNLDVGFKYWLIGLVVMMLSNILIATFTSSQGAENEKTVQAMISAVPWAMLLNAGILAPFVEEITFRKTFKDALPQKWWFILISGIVFGALHVVLSVSSPTDYLYIIPYSALGISFAYMYWKTDTVFTSMSMHLFHNLALTILSILG